MPLHFAAMTGRVDLVEALLDRGALLTKCRQTLPHYLIYKGTTVLVFAVTNARDGLMTELLLRRGADPREPLNYMGATSLCAACTVGNIAGVRALMRHDPSLAEQDDLIGLSPLLYATMTGDARFAAQVRTAVAYC